MLFYRLYKVHIILLPRNLEVIQRLFEEEGLAGYTVIHSYTWEFLPLDYDLLSLELPQVPCTFLHIISIIINSLIKRGVFPES